MTEVGILESESKMFLAQNAGTGSLNSLLCAPSQDPRYAIVRACGGNDDSGIWPGDLLAINFGVNSFDTDAVFVISWGKGLFFRRVQRLPRKDSQMSPHFRHDGNYLELNDETLSEIKVVGRVEEVFQSERNESAREHSRRASA